MTTDACSVCAGTQGPNHQHICNNCGADAGDRALVFGTDGETKRFYCDRFCAAGGEPDRQPTREEGLVLEARKIKSALAEAGVRWEVV